MGRLLYHRSILVAGGTYLTSFIDIKNLGRCRIRIINAVDWTDVAIVSIAIKNIDAPVAMGETISLVNREQQVDAQKDVGWEGDVELSADQSLEIAFEDSYGVGVTAADVLYCTVGYELL